MTPGRRGETTLARIPAPPAASGNVPTCRSSDVWIVPEPGGSCALSARLWEFRVDDDARADRAPPGCRARGSFFHSRPLRVTASSAHRRAGRGPRGPVTRCPRRWTSFRASTRHDAPSFGARTRALGRRHPPPSRPAPRPRPGQQSGHSSPRPGSGGRPCTRCRWRGPRRSRSPPPHRVPGVRGARVAARESGGAPLRAGPASLPPAGSPEPSAAARGGTMTQQHPGVAPGPGSDSPEESP